MKTLDLEELAELARAIGISDRRVAARVRAVEKAMGLLAQDCARILRVEHATTVLDEAGLCSSFVPRENGDPCPEALARFDPAGEFLRAKTPITSREPDEGSL